MMPEHEKTVFIGYKRAVGFYIARAIFHYLHERGYDPFIDINRTDESAPDAHTLKQITSRNHFLIVLTPAMTSSQVGMGQQLREELRYAAQHGRNIVPILAHGFRFGQSPEQLPDSLGDLLNYDPVELPNRQFEEALTRLCEERLKQTGSGSLKPVHPLENEGATQKVARAARVHAPTEDELIAEEYFNKAEARDLKDYTGRIADFSEVIRIRSDYYPAYLGRGIARGRRGDLADAVADFDELLRLKPDYSAGYFYRGVARNAQRDLAGAAADFDEAIRLNPRYTAAYLLRAEVRRGQRDFPGAVSDYNEVIRLKPDLADAYYNRGLARQALDDLPGAIGDYTETVRLASKHAPAYHRRGTANEKHGDQQAALADYDKAIRLNPEFAHAYFDRGRIHKERGDLDSALDDYSQAIKLAPQFKEAFNNRGATRADGDDFAGAEQDFNEAIRLDPTNPIYVHNRGWIYHFRGDNERARADFQESLRLRPDYRPAQAGLAIALYALGAGDDAHRIWQALIAEEPRYADPEWLRSEFHWRPRAVEEARNLIAEL